MPVNVYVLNLRLRLQSGEQVTRLDELQDIDELHVIEVRGASLTCASAGQHQCCGPAAQLPFPELHKYMARSGPPRAVFNRLSNRSDTFTTAADPIRRAAPPEGLRRLIM